MNTFVEKIKQVVARLRPQPRPIAQPAGEPEPVTQPDQANRQHTESTTKENMMTTTVNEGMGRGRGRGKRPPRR